MVNLVRNRHASVFLFNHRLDSTGYILIARVCDNGFRVIIQLILDRSDNLLQLAAYILAEVEAGKHLFIALEQLDRKPAALPFLGHVADQIGDLAERVLDLVGEFVLRRPGAGSRSLPGRLHQLPGSLALERCGLDHRHTQLGGKLFHINRIAALADNIHHIERNNHRDAHFQQLCG